MMRGFFFFLYAQLASASPIRASDGETAQNDSRRLSGRGRDGSAMWNRRADGSELETSVSTHMANRVSLLVVLAFLTFAPLAAAGADESSPLTPAFMGKMLQLIASKGKDKGMSAPVGNALGLCATGQSWPERHVATRASLDNFIHGFCINRGADQDIVPYIRHPDDEVVYYFRAHRDGKVVTAIVAHNRTGQITMRGPSEAQAE